MKVLEVEYRGDVRTFDFWSRSLMAWATNILEDPFLSTVLEWDAVLLEKFNGEKWVRFIHEPWTAERMWNVQVRSLQFYIHHGNMWSE